MKVLVTGATGFVGQHVARRLRQSAEVVVLARDPAKADRVLGSGFSVVQGDLRDRGALERALAGVDVAFHIGARRDHWGRPYSEYYEANVLGTENLLAAARAAGTPKILHCSSVGVHGFDYDYRPVNESHRYGYRLNYYHETKMRAEEIVLRSDLPAVTVRPGWIYGPNDDNGGVTQMLLKIAGRRFAVVGNGQNRLHPVYIDDVVDGIVAAAASERYGEAFLLLGPEVTTLSKFVTAMSDALGVDPPRWRVPYVMALLASYALEPAWHFKNRTIGPGPFGDKPPMTRDSLAVVAEDQLFDISRAEEALGHKPSIGIEQGLQRTVSWLLETQRLPSEVAAGLRRGRHRGGYNQLRPQARSWSGRRK